MTNRGRFFTPMMTFLVAGLEASGVAMGDPAAVKQTIREMDKQWVGAAVLFLTESKRFI